MNIVNYDEAARDDLVIFHHLAKCGGNSVSTMLRKVYGDGYEWFHGPYGALEEIVNGTDKKAVGGHLSMNYPWLSNIQRSVIMFTVLRHPIDRVLSSYYHALGVEGRRGELARNMTLQRIYASGFGREMQVENEMVRNLSVNGSFQSAIDMLDSYTFFGFLELPDHFATLFNNVFGTDLQFPVEHKTGRPPTTEECLETLDVIIEYNVDDMALYEHAREIYREKFMPGAFLRP